VSAISALKSLRKTVISSVVGEDYERLIRLRAIERPHYAYIVLRAADLAHRLGLERISVIEFGVAGGRGLLNLEHHAAHVSKQTSVEIDVYGFDSGTGLPPPHDYRDLPYVWQTSDFHMDEQGLAKRLKNARLVLGDVKDTVPDFTRRYDPAPIGAISFDLDYYSSTVDAFQILSVDPKYRLPRIMTYFDDILGSDVGLLSQRAGVPLAISEFNRDHPSKDLSHLRHLEFAYGPPRAWHQRVYVYSDYEHPRYGDFILPSGRQLPL
jgi:hypothetical protein